MERRAAYFGNHQYLIDEGKLVGVEFDSKRRLGRVMLNDRVRLEGDCHGYVAPGIKRGGWGTVTKINEGETFTDHYFHVLMDDGSEGNIKSARIVEIKSACRILATGSNLAVQL